ncbi:MAG TPA: hypothetical protein VD866_02110 [Urbifossiella sp.]|nr:hypothetical protein [Urbifossiella sp.]
MPRRDAYLTDDDDDTPRRAAASGGGGVPGWVWVAVAGGALALLLVGGLGFFSFNRREAAVRHEVQRADMMRAEVQARPPVMAVPEVGPGGMVGPGGQPPVIPLAQFTNAYKNDRDNANVHYTNRQFQVQVRVKTVGENWAGTSADLGAGAPREMVPNVIFRLVDGQVVPGETVVIEGTCAGLSPGPADGPMRSPTLTFTNCRVVRE